MDKTKSHLFLGVDGGGTKTEAVLIDNHKKELGRGQSQGTNIKALGEKKAITNLSLATKSAIGEITGIKLIGYLALAGVNNRQDIVNWQNALQKHPHLSRIFAHPPEIVNDTHAALRSGTTDKNAIVTIAGTGSNCYGKNEDGKIAKSGGVDYILGDEGSAYDIGLKILKSVTRAEDGRGPKTTLVDLLFSKLKINSLDSLQLLVYEKPWNKIDIAALAPLVEVATESGDEIATTIIKDAALELARMTKTVVLKLNLENKSHTIVESGSVFKMPMIRHFLETNIRQTAKRAKFVRPSISAATAAAYLAIEET